MVLVLALKCGYNNPALKDWAIISFLFLEYNSRPD